MTKVAKEKKQEDHGEEKQVTDKKTLPVVAAPEQTVNEKNSTAPADVDTKLAALKTENERLKLEKDRLAKQLQAQELERQNEKLAKEKEELEKKVQSKSADSGKMKESDSPPPSRGFGTAAAPSAAPQPKKLKLHKTLKKHLG